VAPLISGVMNGVAAASGDRGSPMVQSPRRWKRHKAAQQG